MWIHPIQETTYTKDSIQETTYTNDSTYGPLKYSSTFDTALILSCRIFDKTDSPKQGHRIAYVKPNDIQ